MARGSWAAAALIAFFPAGAHARGAVFLDAELLGGQFFYREASSSFGGLARFDGGYAHEMSERWTAFANYQGGYKGFKDVNDLVGGGTLFQQSMDHRVSLKVERRIGERLTLKPRVAYSKEFFRETNDEKWGKGLYDFDRMGIGLVADYRLGGEERPALLSAGYNFFSTAYPNYKTLFSKFGAEVASVSLGGQSNPGSRTLDTLSHQFNVDLTKEFSGRWNAWSSYNFSLRSFPDQFIIDSQARYLSDKRLDQSHSLDAGVGYKPERTFSLLRARIKTSSNLGYRFEWSASNQNHFDTDPAILTFVPNYYDYVENSLSPGVQALVSPLDLAISLGYNLSIRNYLDRRVQDSDGQYQGATLSQTNHMVSLGASLPIFKRLLFKTSFQWRLSRANTAYEKTYRYNYGSAQYFAGLAYSL